MFNLSPQNHSAATQICCEPWTMHARRIHTSVAAPASSPKLRPKKAKPAADATAYAPVAILEMMSCAGVKLVLTAGSPMRRKATPKKNQGMERTQTEGLKGKSRYHTAEAAKNTEPMTYSWRLVCPFEPESKTI